MKYFILILLFTFIGCSADISNIHSNIEDQNGNFVLYVSNQSFEFGTVDILIEIDDEPVLHRYFKVKNQHNWIKYIFNLPPGKHRIYATSEKGNISIERDFDIENRHWAVINFWYSKKAGHKYQSPTFTFNISNEPIYFI